MPIPARPLLAGALLAAGLASIAPWPITSADAAIRCRGAYQVVKGVGEVATPYCEDKYLVTVARQYGIRVSFAEVRRNYNRKRRICEQIGYDTRLISVCSGLRNEDRRGRVWF